MARRTAWISFTFAALVAAGAGAQDTDDIGPAVDTSAPVVEDIGPAVDTSATVVDDVSPAVDTSSAQPARSRQAIDSLSLDTSQIVGNQELPQVLYIVPWKSSDLGDLVGRPVNTLLDEVLAPADREVFKRQVSYYEDLHGSDEDDT
ncbi:MAG: hypothetical protein AAF545_11150 [Pseudomonadota bacterium]